MEFVFALCCGLMPGALTHLLIKIYEKRDVTIGTLKVPIAMLLLVLSEAGFLSGCYNIGMYFLPSAAVLVNVTMLLFTSYTDMRCGQVYVVFPCISVVCEAVLTVLFLYRNGYPVLSVGRILLLFCIVLFALWKLGLAGADCLIYLSCILSLCIISFRYYMVGALFLILVSNVSALVFNVKKIRGRNNLRQRFPFTAFIAVSCLVTYFLFSFLVYR